MCTEELKQCFSCEIGKTIEESTLEACDSIFDAILDFYALVSICRKQCKYKEVNNYEGTKCES